VILPGWCGTILESVCAFSGQAGEDCHRGGDGDCGGGDAFGGGEDQAEWKRRVAALWPVERPAICSR
jgi:hypothetical protein